MEAADAGEPGASEGGGEIRIAGAEASAAPAPSAGVETAAVLPEVEVDLETTETTAAGVVSGPDGDKDGEAAGQRSASGLADGVATDGTAEVDAASSANGAERPAEASAQGISGAEVAVAGIAPEDAEATKPGTGTGSANGVPGGGNATALQYPPLPPRFGAAGVSSETAAAGLVRPSGEEQSGQAAAGEMLPGETAAGGADAGVRPGQDPDEPELAAAGPTEEPTAADSNTEAADEAQPDLSINAAEAEAETLYVAGEAAPGALVRVYADEEFVGEVEANADGTWLLEADRDVPLGEMMLRADVAPEIGDVPGVDVELPFVRYADSIVLEPGATASGQTGEASANSVPAPVFVIIRRGDNLWTISRRNYGRGIRYDAIFQANRDRIRHPDRIYPGQVFILPTRDKRWAAAK